MLDLQCEMVSKFITQEDPFLKKNNSFFFGTKVAGYKKVFFFLCICIADFEKLNAVRPFLLIFILKLLLFFLKGDRIFYVFQDMFVSCTQCEQGQKGYFLYLVYLGSLYEFIYRVTGLVFYIENCSI